MTGTDTVGLITLSPAKGTVYQLSIVGLFKCKFSVAKHIVCCRSALLPLTNTSQGEERNCEMVIFNYVKISSRRNVSPFLLCNMDVIFALLCDFVLTDSLCKRLMHVKHDKLMLDKKAKLLSRVLLKQSCIPFLGFLVCHFVAVLFCTTCFLCDPLHLEEQLPIFCYILLPFR